MQLPTTDPKLDLESAYEACRTITRREAKNFYYAFLTLPAAKRRAIYAAYAFCRLCDDSVDEETSADAKLKALSDLQANLDNTYSGSASSPVYVALADVARNYKIPQAYFQEIILGVESDLVKDHFQNFDELKDYCYRVASVVGLICLQIFGYKDDDAKEYAVEMGLAMQLTNILRDLKEDSGRDRIYIPLEDMARFGYTEDELSRGVVNNAFRALMEFETERARDLFNKGLALVDTLDGQLKIDVALFSQGGMKVLDAIERQGYDVLGRRPTLSRAAKVRLMLGTMLRLKLLGRP